MLSFLKYVFGVALSVSLRTPGYYAQAPAAGNETVHIRRTRRTNQAYLVNMEDAAKRISRGQGITKNTNTYADEIESELDTAFDHASEDLVVRLTSQFVISKISMQVYL